MSDAVRIEFEFSGEPDMLIEAIRREVGAQGYSLGNLAVRGRKAPEPADWVLVKGISDASTVYGVYGPYAEAFADWALAGLCENSMYQWTKVKLSSGPERTDGQDA